MYTSSTIYPTATDHINKHPYPVNMPPHMQWIPPAVELGYVFAPPYETMDARIDQRSVITIAKMVELIISKTTFTITNDYDVLVILHQIDSYIEEVYPLRSDSKIAAYIPRMLALRARIYTVFFRVLNRHPGWKDAYIGKTNIFSMIAQLYRPLGVTLSLPQNYLEELAICPTIRANTAVEEASNHRDKINSVDKMGGIYSV